MGSKTAFAIAILSVLVWAMLGPTFHFSDTWQLVINTATTIVTFLMVFVIQNTQNRDSKAFHLKLDELIRAIRGARTRLVNLEEFSDEELDQLRKEFERVRARAAVRAERVIDRRDPSDPPPNADRPRRNGADTRQDSPPSTAAPR